MVLPEQRSENVARRARALEHCPEVLDVIMLKYPLKMRPMPGMWVQSVPVTAIPWGGMNTEQRNTLQRSVRQDD